MQYLNSWEEKREKTRSVSPKVGALTCVTSGELERCFYCLKDIGSRIA